MQNISIITVNYNNRNGLIKTIKSVVEQTQKMEYIVIDGGSTDGSVDVINQYKKQIDYWTSEYDGGIYYGMNKGIQHATGEYLLFLNSGDFLYKKNSLYTVANSEFNEDIVVFRQKYIDSNGKISVSPRLRKEEINIEFFLSSVFPHQATLIKRSLFDTVGLYQADYRITADWVFWTESVIRYHASVRIENSFFTVMEQGGISNNIEKCQNEMQRLMSIYLTEGYITWNNIFHIASYGRLYQFSQRNFLSKFLTKVAIWIGKHC